MARDLIVFDGDDTLWFVEPLYDAARQEARRVVEAVGLDGARWEELERVIDVENVAILGLSADRFPTSCMQAYDASAAEARIDADGDVRARVGETARSVFAREAPLADGVPEVLDILRRNYALALLTKGDAAVQERRILDAGVGPLLDKVFIVDQKGIDEFASVLDAFGVSPAHAWSVGNSVPSDINPALELGMRAIWIDAHVWEHERRESDLGNGTALVARSLREVPALLEAT